MRTRSGNESRERDALLTQSPPPPQGRPRLSAGGRALGSGRGGLRAQGAPVARGCPTRSLRHGTALRARGPGCLCGRCSASCMFTGGDTRFKNSSHIFSHRHSKIGSTTAASLFDELFCSDEFSVSLSISFQLKLC